mgnify:CR=1 FL=1
MSEEAKIELELSEDEAMFLAVVLQYVGGSTKGPRGIADEVLAAVPSGGDSAGQERVGRFPHRTGVLLLVGLRAGDGCHRGGRDLCGPPSG